MNNRQYRDFGRIVSVLAHTENFHDLPLRFVRMTLAPSIQLGNYHMVPREAGFFIWGLLSDEASERYERTGTIAAGDLNSGNNLWIFYMAALGSAYRVARVAQKVLTAKYRRPGRSRRHWKGGRVQEWKCAKID